MGRLTTHVLDLASGTPAAGLRIDLHRAGVEPALASVETNADGRIDRPLLEGEAMTPGSYELRFFAGDYLRRNGVPLGESPFLDVIPVRFGIAAGAAHLHVPLLLSPYGYSTYRGS